MVGENDDGPSRRVANNSGLSLMLLLLLLMQEIVLARQRWRTSRSTSSLLPGTHDLSSKTFVAHVHASFGRRGHLLDLRRLGIAALKRLPPADDAAE
jgi:hypothetical protein